MKPAAGVGSRSSFAGLARAALEKHLPRAREASAHWLERYPDVEAQIGNGLKVDDVVEVVFLDAFEQYPNRPAGVRFGEWLEALIDPAVKELLRHPEELESVSLARTLQGVAPTREEK